MAKLPLLLGHRGSRVLAGVPENTLDAFDLALRHGCDGFEFDVRRCADGAAVICHDPKVGNVTVARAKAGQLSQLPRLDEVVRDYGHRAFLDIELKVEDLESKVLEILRQYPPELGYVVSSFIPDVVMNLEARSASASIGIICETRAQLARWPKLPVDFVVVHHLLADETLVEDLKTAGLKILVWTVNDAEVMLRFASWGVDGIISDDTELLVSTLRSNPELSVPKPGTGSSRPRHRA
jgi:glycerophosphoryl diester phosphodiesterase